jgi:hypothetical protein
LLHVVPEDIKVYFLANCTELRRLVLWGISSKLVASIKGDPSRVSNMEILIEEENANEILDTLHVCSLVRNTTLNEMENGTSYDDIYGSLQHIA